MSNAVSDPQSDWEPPENDIQALAIIEDGTITLVGDATIVGDGSPLAFSEEWIESDVAYTIEEKR